MRSILNDARWTSAGFAVLMLAGAVITFWNVGQANPNSDERIYVDAGWAYVHGDLDLNLEHPPTAKLLFGLAQLVGGQGILGPRILVGMLVLGAAAIIWVWMRAEIGAALALIPVAFWLLLPRGLPNDSPRIDRYALLDPVMAFFLIAALWAAWRWYRSMAWWWIAIAGAAFGLAVSSKVSAAIASVGFLVLLSASRSIARTLRDVALFVAAAASVFFTVLAPFGIISTITYMLAFQGAHNANGHLIELPGLVTAFQPWWANLWFNLDAVGPIAAVVLGVGVIAGITIGRPVRLVVYLAVGGGALLAFHLFGSNVALAHYYYTWTPYVIVIAGLGIANLVAPGEASRTSLGRAVGYVAIGLTLIAGIRVGAFSLQDGPRGLARAVEVLHDDPAPDGQILVGGVTDYEYEMHFGDRGVSSVSEGDDIRAIAVRHSTRFPLSPELHAFVTNPPPGVAIWDLDDIRVIAFDGTLHLDGDALVVRSRTE